MDEDHRSGRLAIAGRHRRRGEAEGDEGDEGQRDTGEHVSNPRCPGRVLRAIAGGACDGETRNRTGDTTIFSRVLYQLSYLA